jgi:hypothetical protein
MVLTVNTVLVGCVRQMEDGSSAKLKQFPSVLYFEPSGCTATIIGPKTFITAAQCVCTKKNETYYVVAGTTGVYQPKSWGRLYKVARVIVEPSYPYECYDYEYSDGRDIAVGKVEEPFQFGENVGMAKLATSDEGPLTFAGFEKYDSWAKDYGESFGFLKYGRVNKTTPCGSQFVFIKAVCYKFGHSDGGVIHKERGGPLFNRNGELLGVFSDHYENSTIYAGMVKNKDFISRARKYLEEN